jgi:hypothetical protein
VQQEKSDIYSGVRPRSTRNLLWHREIGLPDLLRCDALMGPAIGTRSLEMALMDLDPPITALITHNVFYEGFSVPGGGD